MYSPNPDRPHDPVQAAADALAELGIAPGDDPHTQLKQLAGDLNARVQQAQAAVGDLTDPDNLPPGAAVRELAGLLAQGITALVPLVETQLDTAEQALLADFIGQDDGGRS